MNIFRVMFPWNLLGIDLSDGTSTMCFESSGHLDARTRKPDDQLKSRQKQWLEVTRN